jgi:DNA-binding transcriptional ArsR family regulator
VQYTKRLVNDGNVNENSDLYNYSGVLSSIFSSASVGQILDFFLDHKEFDYSPLEVAKKTGLAIRTVFREIPNLEKKELIYKNRKIGKTNMYRINADFEGVLLLEKFALEMSQLKTGDKEELINKYPVREGI